MSTQDDGTPKRYAPDRGVVVDNVDPLPLGRVRVVVPGLVDAPGFWAYPAGLAGGGGVNRGAWAVPPVGADVIVFYIGGDVDQPIYFPGSYGVGHAPGPVGGYVRPTDTGDAGAPPDVPTTDAHLIKAFETDAFAVILDDRPGLERAAIEMKRSGVRIVIGEGGNNLEISAVGLLSIKCDGTLRIDAATLVIKNRPVLASSKPI